MIQDFPIINIQLNLDYYSNKMKNWANQIKAFNKKIQQLKNQQKNIADYFSLKQLTDEESIVQASMKQMMNKLQKDQQRAKMRQHVLRNKISKHPARNVLQTVPIQQQVLVDELMAEEIYKDVLSQNCIIQVKIQPIKIHPIYSTQSKYNRQTIIPFNDQSWRFACYHLDKQSRTGFLKHKTNVKLAEQNNNSFKSIFMNIKHQITLSTFEMMKQLITDKNNKFQIYIENQNMIMLGCFRAEFGEFIQMITSQDNQENQQIYESDRKKLKKQQFKMKKTMMLKFTTVDSQVQIFTLQCKVSISKNIISPQMIELSQNMHEQKVIIDEGGRTRSPSPTLHKKLANSLIRTKLKQKVKRFVAMHDREITIPIYNKADQYEPFDKKISIIRTDNVQQPVFQFIQHELTIFLKLILKCTFLSNQGREINKKQQKAQFIQNRWSIFGYIQLKIQNTIYKIDVKHMTLFTKIGLQKSKMMFKNLENIQAFHGLIELNNLVYVRPNTHLKIIDNKNQNKIYKVQNIHQFVPLSSTLDYLKQHMQKEEQKQKQTTQKSKTGKKIIDKQNIFVYPGQVKQLQLSQRQLKVTFQINSQILSKKSAIKVIIAIKGRQKYEENQKQIKNIFFAAHKPISKEFICQQIHLINYSFIDLPPPQLNLQLQASIPGFYKLAVPTGLFQKSNKYQISSCNTNVLVVCRHLIQDIENKIEHIQVQLMMEVKIKQNVKIVVQNISKKVLICINVQINEQQYWKRYDNLYINQKGL